jgi:hypothetical protein
VVCLHSDTRHFVSCVSLSGAPFFVPILSNQQAVLAHVSACAGASVRVRRVLWRGNLNHSPCMPACRGLCGFVPTCNFGARVCVCVCICVWVGLPRASADAVADAGVCRGTRQNQGVLSG